MPGAAFSLRSPPVPPVLLRHLPGPRGPVLPLSAVQEPGVIRQEHAPTALFMPTTSSCALALFFCVEQETLQLRPSPGSCLCSQPGCGTRARLAAGIGLILGAQSAQPGPKQRQQLSLGASPLAGLTHRG